jgi:phosphoribosylanthranilate isomerase
MFSRFQLNFSPYVNNIEIPEFLQGMDREELYFKQIIFQLKDINEPLLIEAKKEDFDVAPIFDISGGRGISPENWPSSNELCGYAGGLNPNNVSQEIVKISIVSKEAWIDAESGLRTNNEFDLDKVEYFLNQSLSWWNFDINAMQNESSQI